MLLTILRDFSVVLCTCMEYQRIPSLFGVWFVYAIFNRDDKGVACSTTGRS